MKNTRNVQVVYFSFLNPDIREQLNQFRNNPTVMALFELGTLYEQRGYEDVAMMAYEKLYKEASHFTPAKVELADLYFNLNQ